MSNKTYRAYSEHLGDIDAADFVAREGDLFWDPETTTLRVGDGTAGGQLVSTGGGGTLDQFARNTANTATSNTIYTQGVDAGQNTLISSAQANTIYTQGVDASQNTKIQAAFDKANTATSGGAIDASEISANTTLTAANSGGFIQISAGSPTTIILPDPALAQNKAIHYVFWQNTSSVITLKTVSTSAFYGPAGSGANTKNLSQATTQHWQVWSDGADYVVFAVKAA